MQPPATQPPAAKRLALTMGDPTGVGPEVIAAVWSSDEVHLLSRPIVLGDPEVMRRAVALRGSAVEVVETDDPAEAFAATGLGRMACLPCGEHDLAGLAPGAVDARSGRAAYDAIVRGARLALAGEADGVVTAPISKAALHAAGLEYPGHTELLAELCGVSDFAMMLYLPPELTPACPVGLGVVHVTLHESVRTAIDTLSLEGVLEKCRLADGVVRRLSAGYDRIGASPRIGVGALNPHAGEGGLFGDEEQRIIAPAVEHARAAGVDARGPFPADTLMVRAVGGEFDAVVAMLHDHGHVALKLIAMHGAVNVTLGLPIVRTSVAHGTAADLAWKGVAETSGMHAAVRAAALLADRRG
ncbi:4-hydroxythreonine-4-phosphate dehydrogenase [Pseudobythopirellula maris]|uniref:4-hydroxythreonine-4-phosphate dehydrogenase n=1 Tax=Pseudobythopirellula maris TaxID=2527991 RepID=A0A5C5ZL63_9BACT|nr:4-hydroxythreonine-4-phosphate dehydrogenase PdxA [Pseudobythopirellula maris]TWT87727.1 4-hydroxythreonine-4-phosphate dehydrogenase [Pseudobythopirellula maris]